MQYFDGIREMHATQFNFSITLIKYSDSVTSHVENIGAKSKAQKQQKDFQVSIYRTRKPKNQKNGPSGALKGGHFRNCQHFCRS